ncbi:hypothetical protein FGG08_007623 [Glutinoglossum americanum]|uniref:Peroxisome assembly protein 12 n=1 Tax=Glutinoglossum americanum TaxID=1670608 RepID=A0A9P8I109_9PEZI|nr:hypothetical protein FGG08_007623 [Glutinoglossum americanum]
MEFMADLQEGIDDLKPSLFELLSEQQLSALLPPSLRYLLALATHRHPRFLLSLLNNFNTLYALLSLLLERHYLLTYSSSFTENFYALKRERVLRVRSGEVPRAQLGAAGLVRDTLNLGRADVWRNLLVLVGVPWAKRRLDEDFEIHAERARVLGGGPAAAFRRDPGLREGATLRERMLRWYKWFLRHVYPSVNAAYHFATLAFSLAYLFDGSRYHSPFLWMVGTRMRRLGEADYRAFAMAAGQAKVPDTGAAAAAVAARTTSMFNPRTFVTTVYPRLLTSLRFLLPTSIFALKFLEWWHASDFARQLSKKATEDLDLPPPIIPGLPPASPQQQQPNKPSPLTAATKPTKPPPPPISRPSLLQILTVPVPPPSSSSLCPICLLPLHTPTAAQSGYVYCYTCIYRWVRGEHERQTAFMEGAAGSEEGWERVEAGRRLGRWESGAGRCAVTGRRVLGGVEGLRRVVA